MLTSNPFYFSLLRSYVILFGSHFDNISVVRTKESTGAEIERIKVPLIYAPKDKYVTRLLSDPDLTKAVQTILPRMSFDIRSVTYDAQRKQNSLLKVVKANSSTSASSQFMAVPYDIVFELNLYTKYLDDANQIIEQILPYFNPDYTSTVELIPEVGVQKDIPLVLTSVDPHIEYEGDYNSVRYVNWTLTFQMKAYFFGPVSRPKIIRKVITSIYNNLQYQNGYITKINLTNGSGNFLDGDIVFQGTDEGTATAYGTVLGWNSDSNALELGAVQGSFIVGREINARSSSARYDISSFDTTPLKLAQITIQPDPIDAEPGDAYGYDTQILEYPNIP